jgi:hypothetical protein
MKIRTLLNSVKSAFQPRSAPVEPELQQTGPPERAPRRDYDGKLLYRRRGALSWSEGTFANLSDTGVLFIAGQAVPVDCEVEMTFRLPRDFGGREEAPVFCWAKVVRVEQLPLVSRPLLAAKITRRRSDPQEARDVRHAIGEW